MSLGAYVERAADSSWCLGQTRWHLMLWPASTGALRLPEDSADAGTGACPTTQSFLPLSGCRCGVPAANATFSSTASPGSCITSCDDVRNRTAMFIAYGKAVPFWAGMYNPQNPAEPSGSKRRLLQGGTSGVWANYTYMEASRSCPATASVCRSPACHPPPGFAEGRHSLAAACMWQALRIMIWSRASADPCRSLLPPCSLICANFPAAPILPSD